MHTPESSDSEPSTNWIFLDPRRDAMAQALLKNTIFAENFKIIQAVDEEITDTILLARTFIANNYSSDQQEDLESSLFCHFGTDTDGEEAKQIDTLLLYIAAQASLINGLLEPDSSSLSADGVTDEKLLVTHKIIRDFTKSGVPEHCVTMVKEVLDAITPETVALAHVDVEEVKMYDYIQNGDQNREADFNDSMRTVNRVLSPLLNRELLEHIVTDDYDDFHLSFYTAIRASIKADFVARSYTDLEDDERAMMVAKINDFVDGQLQAASYKTALSHEKFNALFSHCKQRYLAELRARYPTRWPPE